MAENLYHNEIIQEILRWRRSIRINSVLSMVQTWPGMSVLDVGCGYDGRSFENIMPKDYIITGIDLFEPNKITIAHTHFQYYKQDASDLSIFSYKQFDLAISIGMMEHICDRYTLLKMAREIERVAQQWIILVPWKFTLIEPHFKFLLFQHFPSFMQNSLTIWLNLHNLGQTVRQDRSYISTHYQWLSTKEWMKIFRANKAHVLPPIFDVVAIVKQTTRMV